MSIMEVITKIKTFLNEEVAEVTLTDVKTDDGTILSFDTMEVGQDLFIVDQAGRTPAADGEYCLEDGTCITAKDGKIESVEAPEAPEVPGETPDAEDVKEGPDAMPMGPEGMACKPKLELEELAAKITKCEADNLALAEIVKQLAETLNQQNFKSEVKMSMIKEEVVVAEKQIKNQKTNNLDNIFRNMYK